MEPFVEQANSVMPELEDALLAPITDDLKLIHNETGYEEFIVSGSWASAKIVEAHTNVFHGDEIVDTMDLEANDVDIYHGTFSTDTAKPLAVKLDRIVYKKLIPLLGKSIQWSVTT